MKSVDKTSANRKPSRARSATRQLDAIFRAFPDLLFSLDADGRILDYRAGQASQLYVPPEKFIGRTFQEVLPAEAGTRLEMSLHEAIQTEKIVSTHYRLEVPSGEHWFEAHIVPEDNSNCIVIIRDVTGRVKTTEQVQRQLKRMSALHSIDAVITSSFDLNVTLSVILRQVINHLAVDAVDILLFNSHTRMLDFAAGLGFQTHARGQRPAPVLLGQGFAGLAALERRTVSIPDLDNQLTGLQPSPALLMEKFASYHAVPLIAKGQVKGVMELYNRSIPQVDEEWAEFLATLAGQAAVAIDSASLFQDLQRSNAELTLAYDSAIESWSQFLEVSGRESRQHIFRVVDLTLKLAQLLRVDDHELIHYRRGALLHDVGKVGIPEAILNKRAPLDEAEWIIIRNYPNLSHQMLSSLHHLDPALDIPHFHHERWDGSGYPAGLRGEQIPLPARIVAIVDVFDALQSARPYRPAWSREAALEYIRKQSGILFDPAIVIRFIELMLATP